MRRYAPLMLLLAGASAAGAMDAPTAPTPVVDAAPSVRLPPPRRWMAYTALQAAVATYPELLAPDGSGALALVGIALRPDGSVGASQLRWLLQPAPASNPRNPGRPESEGLLPEEGDAPAFANWPAGADAGAGRLLRVPLRLYFNRVPADFDADRSARRVREVVRRYNRDLLFTGDDTYSRLTVLLGPGGKLLNQHVDRVARDAVQDMPGDPRAVRVMAAQIAGRLRIDEAQVGLMGTTAVHDGAARYLVVYAWQRSPGESAHVLGPLPPRPRIDTQAARLLVDRHFGTAGDGAGTPTLVLSANGEVLRTGHVHLKGGGLTQAALREPLLAGLQVEDVLAQSLESGTGAPRAALFVWQAGTGTVVAAQLPRPNPQQRDAPVFGSRVLILRVLEGAGP